MEVRADKQMTIKAKPGPLTIHIAQTARWLRWTCRTTFAQKADCLTVQVSTFPWYEKPLGRHAWCSPQHAWRG